MRQLENVEVPGSANVNLVRSEFQMMVRTRRDNRKAPRMCPPLFLSPVCAGGGRKLTD
jgi:hypothetical protein